MKHWTRTVATSAALLGAGLGQTNGMNHGGMSMPAEQPVGRLAQMDLTAPLAALHRRSGKSFDRAFLSMMIPHHQMALDMAAAVLPLSHDAAVRTWAKAIITAQRREIQQMTALLKPLGGADARMQRVMQEAAMGMGQSVKASSNPDRAFVSGMVPHHAGAIQMANLALQQSADPQVLQLARDILRAQAQEMYDFQLWLQRR